MTDVRYSITMKISVALALAAVAYAAQYEGRPDRWAQYEREMQDPVPDPPDAWVEAEFAVGRLRFRSPFDGFRRRRWGTDADVRSRNACWNASSIGNCGGCCKKSSTGSFMASPL